MTVPSQHPFHHVQTPYNPTSYQSKSPHHSPVKSLDEAFPSKRQQGQKEGENRHNSQSESPQKNEHDAAKNRRFGKRMYNVNGGEFGNPVAATTANCHKIQMANKNNAPRPILKDRWVTENSSSFVWFGHNPQILPPTFNGGRNGNVDPKLMFLHNYDSEDPLRNGECPNNAEQYKMFMEQQSERRQKIMNGECTCFCPNADTSRVDTGNKSCCTLHNLFCSQKNDSGSCGCSGAVSAHAASGDGISSKSPAWRDHSETPQHSAQPAQRYNQEDYRCDDQQVTPRAESVRDRQARLSNTKGHARVPSSEDEEIVDSQDEESPRHVSSSKHYKHEEYSRKEAPKHGGDTGRARPIARKSPVRSSSARRKQKAVGPRDRPRSSHHGGTNRQSSDKSHKDKAHRATNRSSHEGSSDEVLKSPQNKNSDMYKPTEREILAFKPKQRYKTHFHNYGWANTHPATDAFYMRSHNLNPQHPSQIYPFMKERRERTHNYDEWKNVMGDLVPLPQREEDEERNDYHTKNEEDIRHSPVRRRSVSPPPQPRRKVVSPHRENPLAAPKRPSSAAPKRRPSSTVNRSTTSNRRASSISRSRQSPRNGTRKAKNQGRTSRGKTEAAKKKSPPIFEEEQPVDIPPRRFARRETLRREAEHAQPEQMQSPAKKQVTIDPCDQKEFLPPHYLCNHGHSPQLLPTPSLKSANRPHDLSFTLGGHGNPDPNDPAVIYSSRPACCHIVSAAENNRKRPVVDPRNNPKNYAGLPSSYSAFIKPAGEKTCWSQRAGDCLRMFD